MQEGQPWQGVGEAPVPNERLEEEWVPVKGGDQILGPQRQKQIIVNRRRVGEPKVAEVVENLLTNVQYRSRIWVFGVEAAINLLKVTSLAIAVH